MHWFGMAYNPTWNGYNPSQGAQIPQLSDSDFCNDAFQALWNYGVNPSFNFRSDLQLISYTGCNLLRLYNWGPTRGWNGTAGTAHLNFLSQASSHGMQVIVPISNYFLSDDTYAWNGQAPDATYSFGSAPTAIQADLLNFLSSVTASGKLHPAVHSFSVGNEIDINPLAGQGSSGAVDPAMRLARTIWWIVNLQSQCASKGLGSALFTSPISNADQGGASATSPPSYWFGALVNGVTGGSTPLPNGTVGGSGTFAATWKGLSSVSGYQSWYYNSVNIYQTGAGLAATVGQYDAWTSSSQNSVNWPGQQFTVPLMLTEIGVQRASDSTADQATQAQAILSGIAQTVATYWSRHATSLLMGYCLYEFVDESYLGAKWGVWMQPGGVAYTTATGATPVSWTTFPSYTYPVDDISPVMVSPSQTLFSALASYGAQLTGSAPR